MQEKVKTPKKPKKPRLYRAILPGAKDVHVVNVKGESKLELRNNLGMPRESFGRLVNVSVRTIANVELKQAAANKFLRNYIEVNRLYDALSEVVDPACIGEWFETPNNGFNGLKPLEVVERGEIDRLWEMVYRLKSGAPG